VRPAYLRPNVLVEPLWNQWYAWPYLVPPVTAAMFLINLHVKIMESFIAAPDVHVAAVKNPRLAGGPFMQHPPSRVSEVRALLERTLKEQTTLVEVARAIAALNGLLAAEATGSSLAPLYPRIPEPLRGYVDATSRGRSHDMSGLERRWAPLGTVCSLACGLRRRDRTARRGWPGCRTGRRGTRWTHGARPAPAHDPDDPLPRLLRLATALPTAL